MKQVFYTIFTLFLLQLSSLVLAFDEVPCGAPSHNNQSLVQLESITVTADRADILSMAWSCTRGFFQGAWDASGGQVVDGWDCVTSPIDCAGSAVQGVKNAWNFVKNLSSEISAMYGAFTSMTTQQKADLICELIGSLGASVAMGILIAGPGTAIAAKTIAALTLKMQKLGRILKIAKGIHHRKLARLKDDILDKVDELTQLGYGRFMREAVEACPL